MLSSAIFIKSNLKYQFFVSISISSQIISSISQSFKQSKHQIDYSICQIIPSISQSFSSKQKTRHLVPKSFHFLFNSLSKQQTKPVNFISHICAFSRGVLNVRFMRSHPTLAPRPQICLIGGNGFCAVAGEDELNRGRGFGDRS